MKADTEDRLQPVVKRGFSPFITLFLAIAALAGLLLFWIWGEQETSNSGVDAGAGVAVTASPAPKPKTRAAPNIPRQAKPAAKTVVKADPSTKEILPVKKTLPTPTESNNILLQHLEKTGAGALLPKLAETEHPLDVTTALLDGMSRGVLLRKLLPAEAPAQAFSIFKEEGRIYMDASSYQRYDRYAAAIAAIDTDSVVTSFHALRPLYERAYKGLGLASDDFDNAVIRTLDFILAAPEIDEPIELQQKSVMYLYADPQLEALPGLQKQLLRMGPKNIRLIKEQAQQLRDGLLLKVQSSSR